MPIETLYVVGIILVLAGLAYGTFRSRSRNPANDAVRNEATRELYDDPEKYQQGGSRLSTDSSSPKNNRP